MKGIAYCGACADYDRKKHRCKRGAMQESNSQDKFFDDCPRRWNTLDNYKTRRVYSMCGWDVPEYGKFYSYCPNCGAKMKMEENK